jgi:hypothetical protein
VTVLEYMASVDDEDEDDERLNQIGTCSFPEDSQTKLAYRTCKSNVSSGKAPVMIPQSHLSIMNRY